MLRIRHCEQRAAIHAEYNECLDLNPISLDLWIAMSRIRVSVPETQSVIRDLLADVLFKIHEEI